MKTTLLSAGLFLATVSFAQTNVKSNATIKGESSVQTNKVTSNANASSETNFQGNAVSNAQQKSTAEIKKEHQAVAAEKQSSASKAKAASAKSSVIVEGNEEGELNSTIGSDRKGQSANTHSTTAAESKVAANATVESKDYVETKANKLKHTGKKIKATSENTIHNTATPANAVKIKPVSIRTGTNAGVGFNIK